MKLLAQGTGTKALSINYNAVSLLLPVLLLDNVAS
jgi:hypothetical protein